MPAVSKFLILLWPSRRIWSLVVYTAWDVIGTDAVRQLLGLSGVVSVVVVVHAVDVVDAVYGRCSRCGRSSRDRWIW